MEKKTLLIPKATWLPLILTFVCNDIAYFGTRLLMSDKKHYNLSNPLDEQIPFLPWTLIIYWGCYLFWLVNYVIGCRQEQEEAFRFLGADLFSKLICLVFFLVFPTTNTRPIIEGHSIWEEGMRLLYQMDAADNLLPSIHCLASWLSFIAVRKNERIPKWYRAASFLMAASVCISTLTTKQHVLIDVAAGVALGEFSYQFVGKSGLSKWYMDVKLKLEPKGWGKKFQGR